MRNRPARSADRRTARPWHLHHRVGAWFVQWAVVGLFACQATPRTRLDAALAHYAALSTAMAHDSVAALFTDDGELAGGGPAPLVGPAAIAAFLHTFSGYHVLKDELVADSTRIAADTAWQEGTYRQRVVIPSGDTVEVSGRFRITWRDLPGAGWRIRRMETYSPPA